MRNMMKRVTISSPKNAFSGRMSLKGLSLSKTKSGKDQPAEPQQEPEEEEAPKPEETRRTRGHPFVRLGKAVFSAAKRRLSRRKAWRENERRGSYTSDQGGSQTSRRSSLKKMSEGSGEIWQELDEQAAPKGIRQGAMAEYDGWSYEHPLIPRFEPVVDEIDFDQVQQDLKKLDRTLQRIHPKFQFVEELSPDADMEEQVQSMMPKTRHLNGPLTWAQPRPTLPGDGSRAAVPRLVVVTGHAGGGGNLGLNGVYERHPDVFCGRPVYQKFLEKYLQAYGEPDTDNAPLAYRDLPKKTIGGAGGITYNQRINKMPAPGLISPERRRTNAGLGTEVVRGARQVWFLYFMDTQGRWVIGPYVGSPEVYARCPGSGETVPDGLVGWEVWDLGVKLWRRQRRMQAVKGGD